MKNRNNTNSNRNNNINNNGDLMKKNILDFLVSVGAEIETEDRNAGEINAAHAAIESDLTKVENRRERGELKVSLASAVKIPTAETESVEENVQTEAEVKVEPKKLSKEEAISKYKSQQRALAAARASMKKEVKEIRTTETTIDNSTGETPVSATKEATMGTNKGDSMKKETMKQLSKMSSTELEAVMSLIGNNEEVNMNNLLDNLDQIMDLDEENAVEFFSEESGFALTSIKKMLEEEEEEKHTNAFFKAYREEILSAYGEDTIKAMESNEEFKTLMVGHMKDLANKIYSRPSEADVRVRLQWFNGEAGKWFWTKDSFMGGNSTSTWETSVPFSAIFNEEDGSLLTVSQTVYNLKLEKAVRVVPSIVAYIESLNPRLMIASSEFHGCARIVLSHNRLGQFFGYSSSDNKELSFGDLAEGVVFTEVSDRFEDAIERQLEREQMSEIQFNCAARVTSMAAYDLTGTEELWETNRLNIGYARREKVANIIRSEKLNEQILEYRSLNEKLVNTVIAISNTSKLYGSAEAVILFELSGFTAEQCLEAVFKGKVWIDRNLYFFFKKNSAKKVSAPVDSDVVALINDLNSPCLATLESALTTIKSKDLAKDVFKTACGGHRIHKKEVYFIIKALAA